MDILNIIFEARVNDVATLSEEDKTNIEYHSNSSAAYEKIEALLGDFYPDNAYDVLVAIADKERSHGTNKGNRVDSLFKFIFL